MYGRSETQKKIDEIVLERVKKGIALLQKEHGDGWVDKIDMRKLNLRNGESCVLGQVYEKEAALSWDNGYDHAIVHLGLDVEGSDGEYIVTNYGFCAKRDEWEELQAAWEQELYALIEERSSDD